MRLMALTSGRSMVLPAITNTVSAAAWAIMSAPAQEPTAAEAHSVAAVLSPRTSMPCFMMTPAPRKPIPETDVGDHPHRAVGAGQVHGEIDEGGGADRDQHVGTQARGALPVLPLGADQRAQHEGREQADQRVREVSDLEGRQKPHGPIYGQTMTD